MGPPGLGKAEYGLEGAPSKIIQGAMTLMRHIATLIFAFSAAGCATPRTPSPSSSSEGCFDALVVAAVVGQVPSDLPNPGDGTIIMSWPYFIDLKIKRVIEGDLDLKELTVLSIQHTYWRSDLGDSRWWLRRNTEGSFNILRVEDDEEPQRCASGILPARAYLTPGPNQSLDDMRRAGEQTYGRWP